MIRTLKIALVFFAAVLCLGYALQNVVNLQAAYGFVAAVLTMTDHAAYPNHFGPAITSSFLTWIALAIICLLETAAGLLALKGTLDLVRARTRDASEFNGAKTYGIAGCALGIVVWFGLFLAVGGTYFQMWQTELGAASLEGAFQNATTLGIVLLVLNADDR